MRYQDVVLRLRKWGVTQIVSLLDEELLRRRPTTIHGFAKDTVIVAARHAWCDYERVHAYVCDAGRSFQPIQYLGFYINKQIFPLVARILEVHDHVLFERGRHEGRVAEIVEGLLDEGLHAPLPFEGKVFVLSAPHDPETIRLAGPIVNDLRSARGRVAPFTRGQRYVRLEDLTKATRTSEL